MVGNTKKDFRTNLNDLLKNTWKNIKGVFQKVYGEVSNSKTFWSALAILTILLILSAIVLFIRLHDYVKVDDREISLRSSMDDSLDVFAMEYRNDQGEITIQGNDGEKVVAPGTDVEYTLRLRNTDTIALDYTFLPELEYLSQYHLPIVIRLLNHEDEYVIGNETTWVPLSDIQQVECQGTLMKNETAEYVFQWKWPFESGNDSYDSFLGSLTNDTKVGVNLSFNIHAEANTDIAANGGIFQSPIGTILVISILFILLGTVIVLLLLYILRRVSAGAHAEPMIVEVPVIQTVEVPVIVKEAPPIVSEPRKPGFCGKMTYINIDTFEHLFHSGDRVTIGILKEKGVIPKSAKQMKVLARSAETLDKALIVETQGISKNAEAAICRAGGRVIIAAPDTGDQKH